MRKKISHTRAASHCASAYFVKRILANIAIDDRLDMKASIAGKVESIKKKL